MGELVIYAVELGLMLLVPAAVGLPSLETELVVCVRLKGGELRKRINAALEGDLRGGDELCVFGGELVFALELGDYLGREGL